MKSAQGTYAGGLVRHNERDVQCELGGVLAVVVRDVQRSARVAHLIIIAAVALEILVIVNEALRLREETRMR